MTMREAHACPCGGASYRECCEPVLDGVRVAATAEELMRSRYTAYAVHHADHIFRTWHPRTRPERQPVDPEVDWLGLRILRVERGGPDDDTGLVEFVARRPALVSCGSKKLCGWGYSSSQFPQPVSRSGVERLPITVK